MQSKSITKDKGLIISALTEVRDKRWQVALGKCVNDIAKEALSSI